MIERRDSNKSQHSPCSELELSDGKLIYHKAEVSDDMDLKKIESKSTSNEAQDDNPDRQIVLDKIQHSESNYYESDGVDKDLTKLVPNLFYIRCYALAQGIGSLQLSFALT